MDFNKHVGIDHICKMPWNTINFDGQGRCFVCACSEWLPISVGNIDEFENFDDISNSARAKEIQASILDKSYRYCALNVCQFLKGDREKIYTVPATRPYFLEIAVDRSCNLSCPSYRKEFVYIKSGPEYDKRKKILDKLARMIDDYQHPLFIVLFGDGDLFASDLYADFVTKFSFRNESSKIRIRTNGLLMKNRWHVLERIEHHVQDCQISIDAFTKPVYEKVRRDGNFERLVENLDWLRDNKPHLRVNLLYVVQDLNLEDMLSAYEFMSRYPDWRVNFHRILDWGTYDNFDDQAVWKIQHPKHQRYLEILKILGNSNTVWTRFLTDGI